MTAPATAENLSALVEKIIFSNPATDYYVLLCSYADGQDKSPYRLANTFKAVGHFHALEAGAKITLIGEWKFNPKYKEKQFAVTHWETPLPDSADGLADYLASGVIRFVGDVTAKKIIEHFEGADQTLAILNLPGEQAIAKLCEISGITEFRAQAIKEDWDTQVTTRAIVQFFAKHGLTAKLALRVYRHFGGATMDVAQNDPYRLVDVDGIAFRTADKIALALGLPEDAPSRIEAAVVYALEEAMTRGHLYLPHSEVIENVQEMIRAADVGAAITRLEMQGRIERESINQNDAVYKPAARRAETEAAKQIVRLMRGAVTSRLNQLADSDLDARIDQAAQDAGQLELSGEQRQAICAAILNPVSVITGGPGVGKTTCTKTLVALVKGAQGAVALCAPTGRAAKRLAEATGQEAQTIHRLLGWGGQDFIQDEHHQLDAALIIVDESSMIDQFLCHALLKAVADGAHIVFIGDADQLPSVGAGAVIGEMIASGLVPTTRLSVIFRQSQNSLIVTNAHRVLNGEMPMTAEDRRDFFFAEAEDSRQAVEIVEKLVAERVPEAFNFDPLKDVQVLSPMYRGESGVEALNTALQARLNPANGGESAQIGTRFFRAGDKVMVTKNDYDRAVFNGDAGLIEYVNVDATTVGVLIDGRSVIFKFDELGEMLVHAYAVTVHKSQGGEWPVVIIVCLTANYVMLYRQLLYTAITRARKLCVIVGQKKAAAMAAKNVKELGRFTGLAERLRREVTR